MKKLLPLLLLAALPAFSIADSKDHAFIVRMKNDKVLCRILPHKMTEDVQTYMVRKNKKGADVELYSVLVTKEQFKAGWEDLDQSIKDEAKAAAESDRKDIDKSMKPVDKASASVMLRLVNEARVASGLPEITKKQFKKLVKEEQRGAGQ